MAVIGPIWRPAASMITYPGVHEPAVRMFREYVPVADG